MADAKNHGGRGVSTSLKVISITATALYVTLTSKRKQEAADTRLPAESWTSALTWLGHHHVVALDSSSFRPGRAPSGISLEIYTHDAVSPSLRKIQERRMPSFSTAQHSTAQLTSMASCATPPPCLKGRGKSIHRILRQRARRGDKIQGGCF